MHKPVSTDRTTKQSHTKKVRVLAISSGGGHWIQLLRLRPAWQGADTAYATTHIDYAQDLINQKAPNPRFYAIPDANRGRKLRLALQLSAIALIIIRERPHIVISTGASAGYFALRIAKHFGRRTIWVDSIANADELSLAGARVRPYADLWLTQWPHLSTAARSAEDSPQYLGAVI